MDMFVFCVAAVAFAMAASSELQVRRLTKRVTELEEVVRRTREGR